MNPLGRHNDVQDNYWVEDVDAYNKGSLTVPTLRLVWIDESGYQALGGAVPNDPSEWHSFMRKEGKGKRTPDMIILTCMGFTKEIFDGDKGFEEMMSIAAGLEIKDMPGSRYSFMSLMNIPGSKSVKRSLSLYESEDALDVENTIDSSNTKTGVPVGGLLIGA